MAQLTVADIVRSGLKEALVAAGAAGDKINNTGVNKGKVFASIANASATARTLTISTPRTIDDLAVADRTVVLSGSSRYDVGPFPAATYNTTSGNVELSYSTNNSISLQAKRLPAAT